MIAMLFMLGLVPPLIKKGFRMPWVQGPRLEGIEGLGFRGENV